MATATKKIPPSSPPPSRPERHPSPAMTDRLVRGVERIYRFLASVKLAVISLGSLAATLAYATFFEKWYGTGAVNEYIYRGPYFAILLAFLGTNILCAALIRYPWKKRQTGFVITHAGLLIVLAGSYYSVRTSDEGQVGMLEGDVRSELVRIDHPVIRVWDVDAHTRQYTREYDLPFLPGSFSWGPGRPRPTGLFERIGSLLPTERYESSSAPSETLTRSGDPFQVVAKEYLTASDRAREHVPGPDGTPMARIRVRFKAPGMPQEQDAFPSEDSQWFVTDKKFHRAVREPMRAAPALVTFSTVDRPELVDDFLKPPAASGPKGVARFRYADKAGQTKVFDWPLDGQDGKSVALPDSDLTVTLTEAVEFPTQTGGLDRFLGDDAIPIALFKIQKGSDEPVTHMAMANLPQVPNVIPSHERPDALVKPALATIHYMVQPSLDPKSNGRFGQIDVLAIQDGAHSGRSQALFYRVYGRGKEGVRSELRAAGPLELSRPIVAFGGTPNMPMTISFSVDDYLAAGVERDICVQVDLPTGKMDQGIAACRLEMTVGDETKEIWLRRSTTLDQPRPEVVTFRDGIYALAFDADRKPLGFDLKLDDFEVGFEPGTQQPTKFESQVRLSDKLAGIHDEPHTIWMNHPLDHNGFTFYQMRYQPDIDPHTERPTGRFQSVFQVATNPGRPIIYGGCLLVVLGTFVQFYMRAGVFTDGGKKERDRAAARARAAETKAREVALSQPEEEPDL
jgi:ResB-like family